MSTIVYHSSCTESYFIEPRTTLSLKLNNNNNNNNNNNSSKPSQTTPLSCSSFSSIEALSSTKKHKEESVYVHPLVKHSTLFMLSQTSLEMCTESLGCETGTCDILQTDVVFSPSEHKRPRQKPPQNDVVKFPPPLTTMTGLNSIQVKPYRENGRLVIEAVSSPTAMSCIQAQRSDGRLKLTFVNHHHDYFDDDHEHDEYEENDSFDGKSNFEVINKDNFVGKDHEVEEDNKLEVWNGKKMEFGVKLEMGNLQRTSRCKERGQRLINWEPFWVAT